MEAAVAAVPGQKTLWDGVAGLLKDFGADLNCPICLDLLCDPTQLPCCHFFCWDCINKTFKSATIQCPVCKKSSKKRDLARSQLLDKLTHHFAALQGHVAAGQAGHSLTLLAPQPAQATAAGLNPGPSNAPALPHAKPLGAATHPAPHPAQGLAGPLTNPASLAVTCGDKQHPAVHAALSLSHGLVAKGTTHPPMPGAAAGAKSRGTKRTSPTVAEPAAAEPSGPDVPAGKPAGGCSSGGLQPGSTATTSKQPYKRSRVTAPGKAAKKAQPAQAAAGADAPAQPPPSGTPMQATQSPAAAPPALAQQPPGAGQQGLGPAQHPRPLSATTTATAGTTTTADAAATRPGAPKHQILATPTGKQLPPQGPTVPAGSQSAGPSARLAGTSASPTCSPAMPAGGDAPVPSGLISPGCYGTVLVAGPTPAGGGTSAGATATATRRVPLRLMPWVCPTCTLHNNVTARKCGACRKPRPADALLITPSSLGLDPPASARRSGKAVRSAPPSATKAPLSAPSTTSKGPSPSPAGGIAGAKRALAESMPPPSGPAAPPAKRQAKRGKAGDGATQEVAQALGGAAGTGQGDSQAGRAEDAQAMPAPAARRGAAQKKGVGSGAPPVPPADELEVAAPPAGALATPAPAPKAGGSRGNPAPAPPQSVDRAAAAGKKPPLTGSHSKSAPATPMLGGRAVGRPGDAWAGASQWVLLGSGLSVAEWTVMKRLATLSGCEVVEEWRAGVTHVICGVDAQGRARRTFKYLMGIAHGCWVLGMGWVQACVTTGAPVSHVAHEVAKDTAGGIGGAAAGRAAERGQLLAGCNVLLAGPFSAKEDMQTLLKAAGATLLQRPPAPPTEGVPDRRPPGRGSQQASLAASVFGEAVTAVSEQLGVGYVLVEPEFCASKKVKPVAVAASAVGAGMMLLSYKWLLDCVGSQRIAPTAPYALG